MLGMRLRRGLRLRRERSTARVSLAELLSAHAEGRSVERAVEIRKSSEV
jgi:hypothetical protein